MRFYASNTTLSQSQDKDWAQALRQPLQDAVPAGTVLWLQLRVLARTGGIHYKTPMTIRVMLGYLVLMAE